MKNTQLAAAMLFLIIVFSVNSFGIYAQDVDKNDLIDGLIARGSLIKTGVLLYETETYNIDDYGDGPPWQWSEDYNGLGKLGASIRWIRNRSDEDCRR